MEEDELSKIVLDVAFKIHKELGPGLFESVYEKIMSYELIHEYGLEVKTQVPIVVTWKGMPMDLGFRADLIVENKIIVELKSIETLMPVHPETSAYTFTVNRFETGVTNKF
jgi:GxxExxY protein